MAQAWSLAAPVAASEPSSASDRDILLIPGTSTVAHLHENVASAALRLPAGTVAGLDAIG